MLTLSIIWVALAAAVILVATLRRVAGSSSEASALPRKESGGTLALLAALYGLALLAGFLYVSKYLVSSL